MNRNTAMAITTVSIWVAVATMCIARLYCPSSALETKNFFESIVGGGAVTTIILWLLMAEE